jgi:hypothetical protein
MINKKCDRVVKYIRPRFCPRLQRPAKTAEWMEVWDIERTRGWDEESPVDVKDPGPWLEAVRARALIKKEGKAK